MDRVKVLKAVGTTEMDVQQTVIDMAKASVNSKAINLALKLFPISFGNNTYKQFGNIFYWLLENVTYCFDPVGSEDIKSPDAIFRHKCGDCDDYSVFWLALCQRLGLNAIVRMVDWENDGHLDHIYIIALDKNLNRIILDSVTLTYDYETPHIRQLDRLITIND